MPSVLHESGILGSNEQDTIFFMFVNRSILTATSNAGITVTIKLASQLIKAFLPMSQNSARSIKKLVAPLVNFWTLDKRLLAFLSLFIFFCKCFLSFSSVVSANCCSKSSILESLTLVCLPKAFETPPANILAAPI